MANTTSLTCHGTGCGSTCITYLAEVCAFLRDTARAATLYHLLHPYAGRNVIVGWSSGCYGAASRYLGMLATTMARWDEAEQHFQEALAMNTRTGARPWLAHTQHDYAAMLLARGQPEDHDTGHDPAWRKPWPRRASSACAPSKHGSRPG